METCHTLDFDIGESNGKFLFIIQCTLPVGSTVWFASDTPGPQPPIVLTPTTVVIARFVVGVVSEVPAGYRSAITYCFDTHGQPLPDNWSCQLQVMEVSQ